jgi:hypothetical protein
VSRMQMVCDARYEVRTSNMTRRTTHSYYEEN